MRVAKVKQNVAADHMSKLEGTNMEIDLQNLNYPAWKNDPLFDRCFRCYDTLTDFEEDMLKKENIWVIYEWIGASYKNKQKRYENNKSERCEEDRQERYEDIVCGFLQYYDLQVREGETNHTIYFHWGKLNKGSKECVTIFISPAPLPLGEDKSDYYKGVKELNPPPLSGFSSDPPKPPPPPPPY
jgi:hypothetical protein